MGSSLVKPSVADPSARHELLGNLQALGWSSVGSSLDPNHPFAW
jgi:hypothetical protein